MTNKRKTRKAKRNARVIEKFNELVRKYPQWRTSAIFEKMADEHFFIEPDTLSRIVAGKYP